MKKNIELMLRADASLRPLTRRDTAVGNGVFIRPNPAPSTAKNVAITPDRGTRISGHDRKAHPCQRNVTGVSQKFPRDEGELAFNWRAVRVNSPMTATTPPDRTQGEVQA